jgi:hypothetical protein
MWMPVCGVYALIAVVVLAVWLRRSELSDPPLGDPPG